MTVTYDGGDMFKLWLESGQFVLMSREDCQGVIRNADYIGLDIQNEQVEELQNKLSEAYDNIKGYSDILDGITKACDTLNERITEEFGNVQ